MPRTGIIIPAHNEELLISKCLFSLMPFQDQGDAIIVMDAQSTDQTAAIAATFGVHVIRSKQPERGYTTAEGINHLVNRYSDCEYVITAHADMQFSPNARDKFYHAVRSNPKTIWGCFGHAIDSPGLVYRVLEAGNHIRARFLRFPYGDQAQFFRLDALQTIGFPQQAWYEDLELCYLFQHESRYLYLNAPVLIPTRHWKNGVVRTTIQNRITAYQYHKNRNKLKFTYNNQSVNE